MELNEAMKARRDFLDITQQDLAELSEVSLSTVKDIERGNGNPSLSTVAKLLDVLGLEMDYRVRRTI
ncbi:MAG: helix-turn-helix domain-containing protein [Porphyromonadaceae bacterium]|nr:helix-turn-helix domain-containing protein [Porphyromonadaceae bacterium]